MREKEIERFLRQYGFYASTIAGISMLPMLRPRRDTIFIEATKELSVFDVALYHTPQQKYVLHRVLKIHDDHYVICGDNCVKLEHIPKEWIIGKLTAFYRGEKKMEMKELSYHLYVTLWCRPWRMRIILLKIWHFAGKVIKILYEHK